MYKIGDKVIYASLGVFEVIDERPEQVLGKTAVYYVLATLDEPSASQIFVPKGSEIEKKAMRPLVSREFANELLREVCEIKPLQWINENRARANFSKALIDEGDHRKIIALIKAIDEVQAQRVADGKKPFLQDDHQRARALKLLCSELSTVLGESEEEIKSKLF